MKSKVVIFILSMLIIFITIVLITSNITINKYNEIKLNIDNKIILKKEEIEKKNKKLNEINEKNKTLEKQKENIKNYNKKMKETIKQYER